MATELLSDEELLLRIQGGNNLAFAELVTRHSKKFYNLAYRYLMNREESEDMVQNAFLKIWENPFIWKSDKGAKFTTWFYRIVVNLCLNRKQSNKELALEEDYQLESDEDNQEAIIIEDQRQKLLKREINNLPERQKSALILCFYEGLSHKEAANIMDLSLKAVQSLLMRAKYTLKEKMQKLNEVRK